MYCVWKKYFRYLYPLWKYLEKIFQLFFYLEPKNFQNFFQCSIVCIFLNYRVFTFFCRNFHCFYTWVVETSNLKDLGLKYGVNKVDTWWWGEKMLVKRETWVKYEMTIIKFSSQFHVTFFFQFFSLFLSFSMRLFSCRNRNADFLSFTLILFFRIKLANRFYVFSYSTLRHFQFRIYSCHYSA